MAALKTLIEPEAHFYSLVWEGCVIPSVLNLLWTRVQFKKLIKYYLNVNLYVGSNIKFKDKYIYF